MIKVYAFSAGSQREKRRKLGVDTQREWHRMNATMKASMTLYTRSDLEDYYQLQVGRNGLLTLCNSFIRMMIGECPTSVKLTATNRKPRGKEWVRVNIDLSRGCPATFPDHPNVPSEFKYGTCLFYNLEKTLRDTFVSEVSNQQPFNLWVMVEKVG